MKYLLDTNIIIYFLKGKFPSILGKLSLINPSKIAISSIALAELEYGAYKSKDYEKRKSLFWNFARHFSVLDFDKNAAKEYGRIRADLEKRGELIGGNDMLIAAIALSNNCVLVTHNEKEFSRVENLSIEDWTNPS